MQGDRATQARAGGVTSCGVFELRIQDSGFGFDVLSFQGSGSRVRGSGFRVEGLGFDL